MLHWVMLNALVLSGVHCVRSQYNNCITILRAKEPHLESIHRPLGWLMPFTTTTRPPLSSGITPMRDCWKIPEESVIVLV